MCEQEATRAEILSFPSIQLSILIFSFLSSAVDEQVVTEYSNEPLKRDLKLPFYVSWPSITSRFYGRS